MANKNLFKTLAGKLLPKTNARNNENAPAYAFGAQHALAQYAATGCLNATFYATAEDQLQNTLTLANEVEPEFVARTALYCRTKGYMKDMPALLVAILSVRSPGLMAEVFDRVIDSPKMLRNFVQMMRSGVVGRKSLGTLPKRLVLNWLEEQTDEKLFIGSVGNDPSLADIIKMVHPKPATKSRQALYGYLIGREYVASDLPELVQAFEAYKARQTKLVPDVPFQMLTALNLDTNAWTAIAKNASWQTTRMNLNTFERHGVLKDEKVVREIANKLADAGNVRKAKAFPYQLMIAHAMTTSLPRAITEALQTALEIATENVPALDGKVYVLPDVSGSMKGAAITGHRTGSTSAVRCVDVAALVAATILRKCPDASVIPFEQGVVDVQLNARDSIMTNAARLASIGGGGTNCSAPLAMLNQRKAAVDLVVYVSDNESWVDARPATVPTETMRQWNILKARNKAAKMVCIDLTPNKTTHAAEQGDILNIGGFSDSVFDVISRFAQSTGDRNHWVDVINAEQI